MENDDVKESKRNQTDNRVWGGLLLVIVGGLLLAKKVGADIPGWILSWQMLLIAIGILISLKSGFKNTGGLIMILVGAVFLINDIIPNANMQEFIWPGILIMAGIIFILNPRSPKPVRHNLPAWQEPSVVNESQNFTPVTSSENNNDLPEFVEINSVFGGVKKVIFSKNFRGGQINTFMGGAELNLLQADIKQVIQIEINNVFGGSKVIVPSNWDIKNEMTAVFGGVEDKRSINLPAPDPHKLVILKGACVFGGIEIKNF